jgi:hypothetical protein
MIEDIKSQPSQKVQIPSEKKNNNILDQLEQGSFPNKPLLEKTSSKNILISSNKKRNSRDKEAASPCSSSQNDIHNPSPPPILHKSAQIEKPTNDSESPEILQKLRDQNNSQGRYANKSQRNFKLPLKNIGKDASIIPEEIKKPKEPELPALKKVVSVNLSQRDSNAKVNFHPDPIFNRSQNKIEPNNQLSMNNSKDSTIFQPITKKPSLQKASILNSNQIQSSEQISPINNNPTNLINNKPSNIRKSDRSTKKTSKMTSMDFLSDLSNPGILLKNLLPYFPRNLVVKKQVFFNEATFSIECQIIDDGGIDQALFMLQGRNETTQVALNDEKLNIELFSKILQTVDVKDVLPYENPIKTMESYEDFMRYCVMPFLGVLFFLIYLI